MYQSNTAERDQETLTGFLEEFLSDAIRSAVFTRLNRYRQARVALWREGTGGKRGGGRSAAETFADPELRRIKPKKM